MVKASKLLVKMSNSRIPVYLCHFEGLLKALLYYEDIRTSNKDSKDPIPSDLNIREMVESVFLSTVNHGWMLTSTTMYKVVEFLTQDAEG